MREIAVPRLAAARTVATLAETLARRRRGQAAVEAYQLAQVRELVRHAATNVPAYRDRLTAGDADRLRSLADLASLPSIDKPYLRGLPEGERAWVPAGLRPFVTETSGTSGEPFAIPWAPHAIWRNGVQRLLMMHAMGIRPLDRHAAVMPERRAASGPPPGRVGLTRLLASRRARVSETKPLDEQAADLLRLRPHWLGGEPHSLAAVGGALEGRLRPRTVTSHAVSLDPMLRAELRAAYGTEPLDIYGASEGGQMAWQCKAADLYHVNHEIVVLEIVDEQGRPTPPGEAGDVLITNLLNPLLPMIRYRIGDGATWADRPCACGHRLPALAALAGRTFDWLVDDRDRRVAPPRLWLSALVGDDPDFDGVRRYCMAQDEQGRVHVDLVADPGGAVLAPQALDRLQAAIQRVLGPGTPVVVRTVDDIVMAPGRRFRQFTSARRAQA